MRDLSNLRSRVNYAQFRHVMCEFNNTEVGDSKMFGVIVFTEDSFNEKYPEESRSYIVSNMNKAFRDALGSSLYGSCLDGTDDCVRLDAYMKFGDEQTDGWTVEYCYFL